MLGKKRIIENFEIIHSIQIGARELVVGVSPELEFMCCFCTQDDIAEYYSEAMSSSEYLETELSTAPKPQKSVQKKGRDAHDR